MSFWLMIAVGGSTLLLAGMLVREWAREKQRHIPYLTVTLLLSAWAAIAFYKAAVV